MKPHVFKNSNPAGFDSNCAVCGGKARDSVHGRRNHGRIGEPQEFVEFLLPNGVIYLTQRVGDRWPVYRNSNGAFEVLGCGNSISEGENMAFNFAMQ